MAWIEFHATRIVRLKKFHDFRREMGWSIGEALGLLGLFWGQTVEVCEVGDISGWDAEYLSSLVGLGPQVSGRMLNALVTHGWVDKMPGGKMLVHDWLDWAGAFLRSKYASGSRERLVEIWALHGKEYGRKSDTNGEPIGHQLESKSTLPNRTKPTKKKPPLPPEAGGGGSGSDKPSETPGAPTPKKPLTPLQIIVAGFKMRMNVPEDDKTWDKANYGFYAKHAKAMLDQFEGDLAKTLDCIDALADYFKANKLDWSPKAMVQWAWKYKAGTLNKQEARP